MRGGFSRQEPGLEGSGPGWEHHCRKRIRQSCFSPWGAGDPAVCAPGSCAQGWGRWGKVKG